MTAQCQGLNLARECLLLALSHTRVCVCVKQMVLFVSSLTPLSCNVGCDDFASRHLGNATLRNSHQDLTSSSVEGASVSSAVCRGVVSC